MARAVHRVPQAGGEAAGPHATAWSRETVGGLQRAPAPCLHRFALPGRTPAMLGPDLRPIQRAHFSFVTSVTFLQIRSHSGVLRVRAVTY